MDIDGVKAYLRYVSKVGEYLQISEASSAMLLDNEHRKQIHEENCQWDHIHRDKVYFYQKAIPAGKQKQHHGNGQKQQKTHMKYK